MATRNVVPRSDSEGSVGVTGKRWADGYFDALTVGGVLAPGSVTGFSSNTALFGEATTRTIFTNALQLMVVVNFDAGQTAEPAAGTVLVDATNGRQIEVVEIKLTGGSWVGNDAAGVCYAKALTDLGVDTSPDYYVAQPIDNDVVFEAAAIPVFTVNGSSTGIWYSDTDYDNLNRSGKEVTTTTKTTILHDASKSKVTAVQISKEMLSSASNLDAYNIGISPVDADSSEIFIRNAGSDVDFTSLANCDFSNHIFIFGILK